MSDKMQNTGSRPMGFKGIVSGLIMNLIHANQYKKIIKYVVDNGKYKKPFKILDIGCGGGKVVKLFCKEKNCKNAIGIDISTDMVELSKVVNRKEINSGKAEIVKSNISSLPFEDNFFNISVAFDTINFWEDIDRSMSEIYRTLKDDGMLLIVNGYPKEGTKWWKFVKYKDHTQYHNMLSINGFLDSDIEIRKNTIIIKAYKQKTRY